MSLQKNQSGFAHLMVITIILGLGLVGTLGFVYYQNFIQKKDIVANSGGSTKADDKEKDKNDDPILVPTKSVYSGDLYSFEYPKSGWTVKSDASNKSVSIETADYKLGPMGVEKGSSVTVGGLQYYNSAAEMVASYKAKGMITKTENITVDGQTAYKFSCYEFCSYDTVFDKNGKGYKVTLDSAGGNNTEVYKTVLSTLKIQ